MPSVEKWEWKKKSVEEDNAAGKDAEGIIGMVGFEKWH